MNIFEFIQDLHDICIQLELNIFFPAFYLEQDWKDLRIMYKHAEEKNNFKRLGTVCIPLRIRHFYGSPKKKNEILLRKRIRRGWETEFNKKKN